MKFRNEYTIFLNISDASNGNQDAIQNILNHYEAYISKCCQRPLFDEYNNVCVSTDAELKSLITTALIEMMLKFKVS